MTEPTTPALEGEILTTGPPGKSPIKNPYDSESLLVGDHTQVLGGWHAWRGDGGSTPLSPCLALPFGSS